MFKAHPSRPVDPYPWPAIAQLLQVKCSPATYLEVRQSYETEQKRRFTPFGLIYGHPFLDLLPQYTYAICPWCGACVQEKIDTYHLNDWRYLRHDLTWGISPLSPDSQAGNLWVERFPHCPHFWGVQTFVNLHEQVPEGLPGQAIRYWNYNEQPYVTPWYFTPGWPTVKMVLHALPICRIQAQQFQPTYTVFCLTYYTADRPALQKAWREREQQRAREDKEYYPSRALPFLNDPQLANLTHWAQQGHLGWLDFTQPALPLCFSPAHALPEIYRAIPGQSGGMPERFA